MAKSNKDNLRIRRAYCLWLKDARGFSDASVAKAAASISTYDDWLGGKDFRAFHAERARSFKRHISGQRNARTGAPLSAATIGALLRDLKAFFHWLADQPGYKSKISHADADYFTPDRKSEQARRGTLWKPHPSPEQARQVVAKMPATTVLERRDRALVAFLFLTGSREGAAISLRLGHVDLANRCVAFDGRSVNTKFGKVFTTAFFPIGGILEEVLREWVRELRTDHLFSDADPLFPKTRVGVGATRRFEAQGIARAQWASASSAAKIFKQAFERIGLPPYPPHRVRDTVTELAREHCRTPEDFKAWSQNMGHEDVLTTFRSYGTVPPGRQMELMARFCGQRCANDEGDLDVVD
jgi:integrase